MEEQKDKPEETKETHEHHEHHAKQEHHVASEGHHHGHEHSSHRKKYDMWWKAAAVIFAIILIFVAYRGGFSCTSSGGAMTGQEVADKAVKYLNDNLLAPGTSAKVNSFEESGNLYLLKLSINGQALDTYATKDGKFFFPQAFDLDKKIEAPEPEPAPDIPKTDKPKVLMFTMSYCPYGNQAEDGMSPVARLLGNKVDIEPHYVVYENYRGGGPDYCIDNESKYCSMHGVEELNQDIRELCIYRDQKDKFWDYIDAVNKDCNLGNIEECWEKVAKDTGVDTAKVKKCFEEDALDLVAKEAELNAKHGVRGSPTLIINDVDYSGGRTPEAYKKSICSGFSTEPEECSQTLSGSEQAAPAGGCG